MQKTLSSNEIHPRAVDSPMTALLSTGRFRIALTLLVLWLGDVGMANGQTSNGRPQPPTWDTARIWTEFEEALQRPEKVLRLDLSRSRWKTVDYRLRRFRGLRELVLDHNKLDSLPEWFAELASLERLSAKSNRFATFPSALLGMPHLKELNLADNRIDGIPEDIDEMESVRRLTLWSNLIGHFPASLGNLKQLEELDLLHNEMSVEEQDWVLDLLPGVNVHLSEPCQCRFED